MSVVTIDSNSPHHSTSCTLGHDVTGVMDPPGINGTGGKRRHLPFVAASTFVLPFQKDVSVCVGLNQRHVPHRFSGIGYCISPPDRKWRNDPGVFHLVDLCFRRRNTASAHCPSASPSAHSCVSVFMATVTTVCHSPHQDFRRTSGNFPVNDVLAPIIRTGG